MTHNSIHTPSALLVIDVQQGFDLPYWGKRNNVNAEKNIALLVEEWRNRQWPLIHVQHASTNPESPLHPHQAGFAFKPEALPQLGEMCFQKQVNSAFIGTELEAHLHKQNIQSLTIVGLTTDHCVSTTIRMAANLGFSATLIEDACVTFDRNDIHGNYVDAQTIHDIHCLSLNEEFCCVSNTQTRLKQIQAEAE